MLQTSTVVVSDDGFWDSLEPLLEFPLRVVPINPNARNPLWAYWEFGTIRKTTGRYGSSSTTDRERLRRVTEGPVRPAIGVPQGQPLGSGYSLVLDVDAENGGLESWADLCGRLGEPPPTATVLTKTEDCFHKWFSSSSQWLDAPKELGPGVEVKRAGHLSIVPPTYGYSWAQAPWQDEGIWGWNELDAYLGLVSVPANPSRVSYLDTAVSIPQIGDWSSVDDYLRAISSAAPGARTDALLRYGGKVAYATATGGGLKSPHAVRQALWGACWTNGLVESYDADELNRKIEVYERWADPALNPLLRGDLPLLRSGGSEGGHKVMTGFSGRSAESDRRVFTDLSRFARWEFKPYPVRWAVKSTGLGYEAVRGALARLERDGLIERGPSRANVGKRATHAYRIR